MWQIPSLRSIHTVKCAEISPDAREMALAGITVAVIAQPRKIEFFGKASLKAEESSSAIGAKCELSFTASGKIDLSEPLAFIAEDHYGTRWLIGAFEPPFAQISATFETGGSPKDQRRISYTVSWHFFPVEADVWLPSDTASALS